MSRHGYDAAIAAAALLATVSVARADGEAASLKDTPGAAESYVWDGLYAGFGGGAGRLSSSASLDLSKTKSLEKRQCYDNVPAIDAIQSSSYDCSPWYEIWSDTDSTSGKFEDEDWHFFGTIQFGYDRLIHDRLLIGAFGDVDVYGDGSSSFSADWVKGYKEIASVNGSLDLERVWSVGGRLGFLVTPRLLIYGVGGYTEAKLDGNAEVYFKGFKDPLLLSTDELHGYFIGGGGEFKLRKNISLKLEYRYADYGSESASASGSWSDNFGCGYDKECKFSKAVGATGSVDAEIHSVRAALIVKFGGPERAAAPLK